MQKSIQLIQDLSNAFGVSGFETDVAQVASDYVADFAHVRQDRMGNVFLKPDAAQAADNKLNVLLDAHLDEVGFIVQAIHDNGMLDFLPVGGWAINNVPAHTVQIKTRKQGIVKGITASTPPHFMTEADRKAPLDFDKIVIDVGTSSKAATEALGIEIGNPIVPDVSFETLHDGEILLGKAFDCRIGCAALLETFEQYVQGEPNPALDLEAVLTTQEEVGLRGATVVANQISADIAIVFEGCPADDTFTPTYKIQSALGKGPMLRHFDVSMITHPGFQAFAMDIAEKYNIPMQTSVRKGGGTNGSAYHLANQGIPTIVVGIPVRYAHTHYGFVHFADYQHAIQLVLAILKDLTAEVF